MFLKIHFFSITIAFAILIINNLSQSIKLKKLSSFIKNVNIVTIGAIFTIYLGLVSIQGMYVTSFDKFSVKTAKFAIGNFIPVVGGFVSDSMDILLSSSQLIKNVFGGIGLVLLIGICLIPIIKVLSVVTVYKVAAIVVEPVGEEGISSFLNDVANLMVIMLACIIAITIMFFVTIAIFNIHKCSDSLGGCYMLESLKSWIITILIGAFIVSIVDMILPKSKMKPYINLVVNFIFVFIVITPIISLLSDNMSLEDKLLQLMNSYNKEYIESSNRLASETGKNSLINGYEDGLKHVLELKLDEYGYELEDIEFNGSDISNIKLKEKNNSNKNEKEDIQSSENEKIEQVFKKKEKNMN